MGYNEQISRGDIDVLAPDPVMQSIAKSAVENSAFLQLARRLPDMPAGTQRMPVMSALPVAYWVDEAKPKQTSTAQWDHVHINAAEAAVIVPIPEQVIADANYNIEGEVVPYIGQAIGALVDLAAIFDSGAPAAWPDGLVHTATDAGNVVAEGTGADLYDDFLSEGGVFAKVEAAGYDVSGVVGSIALKGKLRGVRDDNGQPIFKREGMQGKTNYYLDGVPGQFPKNGGFDPSAALAIVGDWNQAVYAIRQDITIKRLTEATITDNGTPRAIIFSLGQDDMIALRVTWRAGWALPNPVSALGTGCPFAVLTPAPGSGS